MSVPKTEGDSVSPRHSEASVAAWVSRLKQNRPKPITEPASASTFRLDVANAFNPPRFPPSKPAYAVRNNVDEVKTAGSALQRHQSGCIASFHASDAGVPIADSALGILERRVDLLPRPVHAAIIRGQPMVL